MALAAAAFVPQVASAATTTVGSPLTATYSVVGSGGHITISNGGPSRVSPVDGTVISWSFVGEGTYTPRVLRPLGDGTYVGAGAGAPMLGSPAGISGPFATSLAIRKGEQFGADVSADGSVGRAAPTPGSIRQIWSPALPLSGAARAPSQSIADAELAVGAVVRYCLVPKVEGKKPKRAKRLLREADCTVGKTRKSKKTRRSRKIVKQSVKQGTSISDTEPINLKVSRTR